MTDEQEQALRAVLKFLGTHPEDMDTAVRIFDSNPKLLAAFIRKWKGRVNDS